MDRKKDKKKQGKKDKTKKKDRTKKEEKPAKVGDVIGLTTEELAEILAKEGLDEKRIKSGDEIKVPAEQIKEIVEKRKREIHKRKELEPCFACEQNQKLVDGHNLTIKRDGYIILPVQKNPQCMITLGLTETYGFPELIVIEDDPFEAEEMLIKQFVKSCVSEKKFYEEDIFILKNEHNDQQLPIAVRPILKKERLYYMKLATHKYKRNGYKAVQLLIPDIQGKLPNEDNYSLYLDSRYLLYAHCWNCLKTSTEPSGIPMKLSKCSKCHHATYCNVGCQKSNWDTHNEQCSKLKKYRDFLCSL